MIHHLLYALSRVLPTPMRATYRTYSPLGVPHGDLPDDAYGPRQRAWWVQWRGRVLWERTITPPWTRTLRG